MKVIILRSISGGGKTRLAHKLSDIVRRKFGGGAHLIVSSDDYFIGLDDGVYRYVPADQGKAHNWCLMKFMKAFSWVDFSKKERPALVVVDNTNTRVAEIAPYYAIAQAHDAAVHIVTIICDPYLAAECGTHDVPNHVMWGQHQRILSEQIPSWWKHTVCFRRREVEADHIAGESTYNDGVVLDITKLLESMDEQLMEATR